MDRVLLTVGGKRFEGWKTAHVVRSIDAVAGAFEVTLSEKYPDRPSARELSADAANGRVEVTVSVEDDVVLTGYIDAITIETGAQGVAVSIQGRDKTGDLVDCAPDLKPSQWKNIDLRRLAEILCEPFGIPVLALVDDVGPAFPLVMLSPGDTAWNLLEEFASYRAVLPISDGQGALILTEAGMAGRGEPLVHGQNLLGSTFARSNVDRFETYIVRGQSSGTEHVYGVAAASAEGRAFDDAVRKGRTLVIIVGSAVDAGRCKKRADYEATVRAGRAEQISATVAGWRQSTGDLWIPNLKSSFESDVFGVHAELVVAQVTLNQEENSQTATLDLVRPDAFAPLSEPAVKDSEFGTSDD